MQAIHAETIKQNTLDIPITVNLWLNHIISRISATPLLALLVECYISWL